MTVPRLLKDALARDGARPFVTFYDESTGERIELSVATTANWVAKTANMLQDSLDAESGSRVHLDLPLHWETVVWLLACWSVGCSVSTAEGAATDVAVLGPDLGGDLPTTAYDHVVALSLRPLGGRFAEPLPAGVVDYNAEVLGHGDHFAAWDEPTAQTVALSSPGDEVDHGGLLARADELAATEHLTAGARLLVTTRAALLDALTTALALGGSLVLVTSPDGTPASPERLEHLADAEHVTARLG